jgi:hypothetical protein
MKQRVAVGMVCAVLAGGASSVQAAPKIEFEKTVYDFGTTSQVDQVAGTFIFKNTGDEELKIQKPQPSCGCTVAGVKPDTLKPGESGELSFTLNLGNVRGITAKHITVPSNDPDNASVQLTIKADVKPTYDFNPLQISFGDVRPGAATNLTVDVKRVDGQKLVITKVETGDEQISAKFEPVEGTEDAARIFVEAKIEGAPRRFGGQIRVYGENESKPAFSIPLFGRLVGDISLTPEALFWGITDPDNWPGPSGEVMTTRRLVVTSTRSDQNLELRNPVSSLKELKLEVQPLETGKTYAVVAKLPEALHESAQGTISFETSVGSQPKIVVPVIINVMKR